MAASRCSLSASCCSSSSPSFTAAPAESSSTGQRGSSSTTLRGGPAEAGSGGSPSALSPRRRTQARAAAKQQARMAPCAGADGGLRKISGEPFARTSIWLYLFFDSTSIVVDLAVLELDLVGDFSLSLSWRIVVVGSSSQASSDGAPALLRLRGRPDTKLLSCLVSCCRRASALLPARAAQGYGVKNVAVLVFYASAGTALVALYARSGKVSAARRVFSYMDGEDVVSWNAMIGGFASAGSGRDREAWNCFREMRVRGVRGNARTAVAVLGACDLDSGRQVHGNMLRIHGGGSKTILWNALMIMYSRVGCVSDAEQVFLEIERKDVVSWNVMIGVFAIWTKGS
nr:unnamed protein product [Digitaria exilis]